MSTQYIKKLSILAAAVALAITPARLLLAEDHDDDEEPFDEAHIFFELNDTDGDLGIHALIDGEPWKKLAIEDPNERSMLRVNVRGRLKRQGLTEFFFESAEPTFDELDPDDFFKRFPEGEYEIEGVTLEGDELESEVELSHVMPAPPVAEINGEAMGLQCDDEEPGFDAPEVSAPVKISWEEVDMSHPDPNGGGAGVQSPVGVDIHNYELVVEYETDDFTSKFTTIVGPDVTEMTLPAEFVALAEPGDAFKFEVLVREENYNQTAVESCFELEE